MKSDPSATVRLFIGQMPVHPGEIETNLARAEAEIGAAAARGGDVILLPEALDVGWAHPTALRFADSVPGGAVCCRLVAAARRQGIWVAAGITERAGTDIFNAAVLIDPTAGVVAVHRKIHELDHAREIYSVGDRLGVVETPLGRLGLMICADAFAPGEVVSRTLGLMGADLILSPCAWAVPADHDPVRDPYGGLWRGCYGPVARAHGLTIAGCSNVGPIPEGAWAGRRCIGNSLVVGPDGEVLAEGPYGETAHALLEVPVSRRGPGRSVFGAFPGSGCLARVGAE